MQQASSTHGAALAHADTGQDGDIASDPAILLDDNVAAQSLAAAALTTSRVDGIRGAHELDVGAEDASIADGDGAGVGDAAVGADQHVVADVDVVTVVAVERRFDGDVLAHAALRDNGRLRIDATLDDRFGGRTACHDLTEAALALIRTGPVRRVGGIVETPDGGHAVLAILSECWTEWGIVVAL